MGNKTQTYSKVEEENSEKMQRTRRGNFLDIGGGAGEVVIRKCEESLEAWW